MIIPLYIPGVAEYGFCKEKFESAERMLEDSDTDKQENKQELSAVLKILGQNPDAVRFLKAEFGERYVQVYDRLTKISPFSGLELTVDEFSADNGKKRTQNDWFDYWDDVNDGRVMVSMGSLYQTFKLLKRMSEDGTNEDIVLAQRFVDSLRDDFDWSGKKNWLISSTRVNYSGNDNLDGKIIQYYRSKQAELMKQTNLTIPVYRDTQITEVIKDIDGLVYLQTLFDTEDDSEEIMRALEFISGKGRSKIKVWSAATDGKVWKYTRDSDPTRAAGFDCYVSEFRVFGSGDVVSQGCSRGVLISPR